MKYILTDDYEIYKVDKKSPYRYYCSVNKRTWISIPKQCVIKEGHTIKELCDEFVGIDNRGHYIFPKWLNDRLIMPLENVNYYGAVWADKGLIFVAKMNKKGKWELL